MAYILFIPEYHPAHRPPHPPGFDFEPDFDDSSLPIEQQTWFLAAFGMRIPPERFPKRAVLQRRNKISRDIIGVWTVCWTVDERVKAILEQYAPSQLEYMPVEILTKGGRPVNEHRYCFTNILPRLDSIVWSKSNLTMMGTHPRTGGKDVAWPETGPHGPLIVTIRKRPPDIHIWHESDLGNLSHWVFASDELAAAFRSAGVQKLYYVYVEEV